MQVPSLPSWNTLRHWSLMTSIFLLAACGGDSCGCDGLEERPFPPEHYDKTFEQGAQVRIAQSGLQFVENNLDPIIAGALPDGLSFCLPKSDTICFPYTTNQFGNSRGTQPMCTDGSDGCQLNLTIEDAKLTPMPNDTLLVEVTVGGINNTLTVEQSGIECDVQLHKAGDTSLPATITAQVPVTFSIDEASPLKELRIDIGEIQLELNDLDFRLRGRGLDAVTCALAGFAADLLRNTIEGFLKDELLSQVDPLIRENLCLSCADDPNACPDNAVCGGDEVCQYVGSEECVPTKFGIEGRLLLGQAIGDFVETPDAAVDLVVNAGDHASVDTGITIAAHSGFQPARFSRCAPVDTTTRPSFEPIPISPSISGDTKPSNGAPFMIGIGVHKRMIEHVLWSTWASGGTCLALDSAAADGLLNTNILRTLLALRSLGNITNRNEARDTIIQISPQTPPKIELGANTITPEGDTYRVDDPLFTVDWKDLDINFYGYVLDRYALLFTARVDVNLPIALTVNAAGELEVVLGELADAFSNFRILNSQMLEEDDALLESRVPQLVEFAIGQFAGDLTSGLNFELPEFFGFKLAITQDDITSVDNNQMIALYADIALAPMMPMNLTQLPTIAIEDLEVVMPEANERGLVVPFVKLQASSELPGRIYEQLDAEYSWRVDGGVWSQWIRSEGDLTIRDAAFILPGTHNIEVRSRVRGQTSIASPAPAVREVLIDALGPDLEIERNGPIVTFYGRDLATKDDALTYRHRIHDGASARDWSDWSATRTLDVRTLQVPDAWRLEVQVRDQAGHTSTATQTIRYQAPVELPTATPADVAATQGGCAAVGTKDSLPSPWWAAFGVLMLGLGRRRKLAARALALVSLLTFGSACDGCGADPVSTTPECTPECAEGEVCMEDGTCASMNKPCSGDGDCTGGLLCQGGMCVEPECREDAQCTECATGTTGVCMGNACTCADICPEGCDEGQFCCYSAGGCQDTPDPCAGQVCEPGFMPEASAAGTPNSETCMLDGAACGCVPMPPLPLGYHGLYADLASDGTTTLISAYNQTYGDLMVGVVPAAGDDVNWQFVEGVPASGDIEGALDGPRGGIKDGGPNVGTHTAIALDGQGNVHVLYRDEDNDTLKYARGTGAPGSYTFESVVLDDTDSPGTFTDAVLVGTTLHVVYRSDATAPAANGPWLTQVRHVAIDTAAAVADAATAPKTIATSGPAANPCGMDCSGDAQCVLATGQCTAPSGVCDPGCGDGTICDGGTCAPTLVDPGVISMPTTTGLFLDLTAKDDALLLSFYDHAQRRAGYVTRAPDGAWSTPNLLDAPSGPYISAQLDDAGTIHVAYMNTELRQLVYEQIGSGVREVISEGLRDNGVQWFMTRIGDDVTLRLDAQGAPHVVFHDAALKIMYSAKRGGSNMWTLTKLSEPEDKSPGARGFYTNMLRTTGETIAVEYVLEAKAETPRGYPSFHRIP